jgi:hypothetical protein
VHLANIRAPNPLVPGQNCIENASGYAQTRPWKIQTCVDSRKAKVRGPNLHGAGRAHRIQHIEFAQQIDSSWRQKPATYLFSWKRIAIECDGLNTAPP